MVQEILVDREGGVLEYAPPGRRARILHLEDNVSDRELVRKELARIGIDCELEGVSTKEEFLEQLGRQQYDLVISDSSLPAFASNEALTVVRARYPSMPFIVFSGHVTDDLRGNNGITATVPKEKVGDLATAVARILNSESIEDVLTRLQWPHTARCLVQTLEQDTDLGILVFDSDRRIIMWNAQMEQLHGLPAGKALSRPVLEVLSSIGRNGEDLLMYSIVKGERMTWKESSHVHRVTNVPISVVSSFLPFVDSKNSLAGGMVLSRNISVYKRMVQAGRIVEQAFRSAVDGAADAILLMNEDGKILYGNQKLRRMLGLRSEDLTNREFTSFLVADSCATWKSILPDLCRVSACYVPLNFKRGDGFFTAEVGVSAASAGKRLLIVRDISEQEARYEDLSQSRDFFQSLVEKTGEVVFSVSEDLRVNFVNPTFTGMTGWSKWIWLGRDLCSLIHPDDAALWKHNLATVLEGNAVAAFRLRLRCADGKYMRGECSCSPVLQRGRVSGVWHIIRSIDDPFFPDSRSRDEFHQLATGYMA